MQSFFFLTAVLFPLANSGYVSGPLPARNVKSICPRCANGGNACGGGPDSEWSKDSATVGLNGQYTTSLSEVKPGQIIDFEITANTGPMGVFVFELCRPNGATKIEHSCFKQRLKRDPTDTRYSPYDDRYPEYSFFRHNSCIDDNETKVRYIIPKDAADCDHCVLRWFWQTSSSCLAHPALSRNNSIVASWRQETNPACTVAIPNVGDELCGDNCPTDKCAAAKFTNCMDIRITGGGEPSGGGKPSAAHVASCLMITTFVAHQILEMVWRV